jgi:CubicO group peptidase (beta-lactamase class C family)
MTSPLASLHAVAIVATLTSALPAGISDAAGPVDERAAALDKAIPLAMQRASIPGAIVGIWPDGSESYVRAFGLRDTATGEKMAPDLYMRMGSNSKIAFSHEPLFPSGSAFDYCNTNTVLLGVVVEKVSGQSLASFIEQHILKPEGLAQPCSRREPSSRRRIPKATSTAGRQDCRRHGLESVLGLGLGQHDLVARRHARVDARPRPRQAALARHEAGWPRDMASRSKTRTAGSAITATS